MALSGPEVIHLIKTEFHPVYVRERQKLDRIDRWGRWDHDLPHRPRQATPEYRELSYRAQAPWGDLIVGSIAQTLYVEGYRRPGDLEDNSGWDRWQANRMDAMQVPLHRAALMYGLSYESVMPGRNPLTQEPMPAMRCLSPRDMIAFYDDPASDEWPVYAYQVSRVRGGVRLYVYDDTCRYTVKAKDVDEITLSGDVIEEPHEVGVCPIVRFRNRADLEGRSAGEIEPFIPLLGRIDQTVFDRIVVQRFGAWIVRTIAGMDLSATATAANVSTETAQMLLRVSDLLVASDPNARFGSLPATPLDGFIKAKEADLQDMAAVSQTPAFELMGQMVNMSAEGLEVARASQAAKSTEIRHTFGESHEQAIRLAAHIAGDTEAAQDFSGQVRWADTSIRSIAQAADAFGKLVTMLGIPAEVLWPKIPGFTQQDVNDAKAQAADMQGALGAATDAIMRNLSSVPTPPELAAG